MTKVKERLIGAITVMNDTDAEKMWDYIQQQFVNKWEDIEEVEPDSIDIQMLREAEENPDCKAFITEEELKKELGI